MALLEPVVADGGYDLEDVQVSPAGNRRLVRVLLDGDGGVTLDDVAALSRLVSEALDGADAMGAQPYVLEVSSPGVDFPLSLPRHWRRATGRLVKVSVGGAGALTARVTWTDGEAVTFLDAAGREQTHPLAALGRGSVQVEFARSEAQPDHDHSTDDSTEDLEDELERGAEEANA